MQVWRYKFCILEDADQWLFVEEKIAPAPSKCKARLNEGWRVETPWSSDVGCYLVDIVEKRWSRCCCRENHDEFDEGFVIYGREAI